MSERLDELAIGLAFGIKVFFNPLCLKDTNEPAKIYCRRKWQTTAQANRKQKKWMRRFGTKKVPCMYRTPIGLFFHTAFKADMDAVFKELTIEAMRTRRTDMFTYA